ncbi:NADH-quinone oxidoreductase subunit K [Dankookia rubra]|uniref:NADH-quinone oxidoreductase subunit K n=1 Tax=Dankookia rubra TaxID=1442381 RepID=UPI0019D602A3|nr:NADH-quinone oxidoreductase subunit K [Dankookia rubra]
MTLLGIGASALVGIGLYGLLTRPEPLRRILAANLLGSGVVLLLGAQPASQAIAVTALAIGTAATALALALLLRLRTEA